MRAALVLSLMFWSCAHTFPARYDLEALRADSAKWPGEALVHYLSRPGADDTVCDRANFSRLDSALTEPFIDSLDSERMPLQLWVACAQRLLPSLPETSRGAFVERLSSLTLTFVKRPDLARLRATYDVLARRPREPAPALRKLRSQLPAQPSTRALNALVESLRALLDLDDGIVDGQPLTEATVLQLDDEALLRRIDARAPDEALRTAARRRIVRIHIAQSPVKEVQTRAAEVEAAVMKAGRWAQPLGSLAAPVPQPPLVAPVDVRLSQDIEAQLASPFVAGDDARRAPAIDLRPLLRFHVGWSEPLVLCEAPDSLAVAPCIDAADVQLGTGFATLDRAGVLHLAQKWAMADAIDLTATGLGLVVPVKLGERLSQVVQVPLTAQVPGSFCFEGAPTDRGPLVSAVVVPAAHGLLVEAVDERGRRVQFVLPRNAAGVEFGSCGGRGRAGTAGSPGASGSSGTTGSSAMCPSSPGGRGGNGSNGTPGGAGGDGGPGGEGGALRVELHCGKNCEDEALVRAVFRSRGGLGGEGGPGGQGGRGGAGGAGGSGTSCYQNGKSSYASGGSPGSSGSNGPQGSAGRRGAPGSDGVVEVLRR
ncbi:MAG: hypothetical protein Q8N23_00555 [Archangium sp.]|nr:hypothetical protein [Archangium sp.]MDP3571808.1 hypothetical protein [Archangium sp.]